MPDAVESGRVKLQGSFDFHLHPLGVGATDIWVPKATTSLCPNLHGKRMSLSSSSPK